MKLMSKSVNILRIMMIIMFIGSVIIPVGASSQVEKDEHLSVVATTSMIADVAAEVAGDNIEVITILGYGQDPHGYTLTPKDMASVENADALFVNGFDLEEHMLDSLKNVAAKLIIEVSDGISPIEHAEEDGDHSHTTDPHTWMSPRNVVVWVDNMVSAFLKIDPDNAAYYTNRGRLYQKKLQELHSESIERLAEIVPEQRVLITDHDVFGYFARDYGFSVAGNVVPSVSTNADISARHLSQLIATIQDQNIPAIFVSSTAGGETEKMIHMIQKEITRPLHVIKLLSGSLQPEGMPGHTYIDFVRFNVDQVIAGLSVAN